MSCDESFVKLQDVCLKICSGGTPRTANKEFYVNGVIPWVKTKEVNNNKIFEAETYITEEALAKSSAKLIPANSVIIAMYGNGDTAGRVAINKIPVSTNQACCNLIVDPEKADYRFVFYYLRTQYQKLVDLKNGGAQQNLNATLLKEYLFPKVALQTQIKIADFLERLDYKIILNTQTNQTLEEMAQAIFKSWFVDFDPVKAKMRGEQPEGMDADTASLFPDKLDCETGLPEGWSDGTISDIAKLNGKSWTKKKHPDEVHYVDLANTKNGVIESITSYTFEEAPSRARRVLNSGDTIVGTVRPGNRSFAYIGQTEQPLTGSTGFAVLTPNEEFWTSFAYLATTNDDAIEEYARLADGGAYPAIKPTIVAETICAIPSEDIAKKFWEITGPMLKKAHQNRLENEELAALRDTLLPKLLSGDIELEETKI